MSYSYYSMKLKNLIKLFIVNSITTNSMGGGGIASII